MAKSIRENLKMENEKAREFGRNQKTPYQTFMKDNFKMTSNMDLENSDGKVAISTEESLDLMKGMDREQWIGQMGQAMSEFGKMEFSMDTDK